jgi:hypothetical protein
MSYSLSQLREIPIIFIVGKGRSGTTLLSTILDSHPNIASATESRFLLMVWQKYRNMKRWRPEMAQDYIDSLYQDFRVQLFWEFDEGFKENLEALPEETKVSDLIKLTYLFKKSLFEKDKVSCIIDKNPRYTIFVNKLRYIFPEAKFIRIVRDPRDNVASSIKHNKRRVEGIAYKWLKYNQHFDAFEQKDKLAATFSFEDLITDKEDYFKRFEAFTGLANLLEHEGKRLTKKEELKRNLNDSLKKQHGHTVKPMDPKKIGHFHSKLQAVQIKKVEAVCFPYAEKFGYRKVGQNGKLGPKNRLKLRLHYTLKYYANQVIYNLPFSLMITARSFILNHIQKGKKKKYKSLLNE